MRWSPADAVLRGRRGYEARGGHGARIDDAPSAKRPVATFVRKRGAAPIGGNRRRHSNIGLGGIADVANRGLRSDVPSVLQMEDTATEIFRCAETSHYALDPCQYGSFEAFHDGSQKGTARPGARIAKVHRTPRATPRHGRESTEDNDVHELD